MSAKKKALQTGKIAVPRLSIFTPHSFLGTYDSYLNTVRRNSPARALVSADNPTIDLEYEKQVKDRLNDKSLVERYMQEGASSEQGERSFSRLQRHSRLGSGGPDLESDVKSLNLPEVDRHRKAQGAKVFDTQTYADFASKAEKRNPNFAFTRSSMDGAFEEKSKRLMSGKGIQPSPDQYERMMSRCLGKESEEYWKDR